MVACGKPDKAKPLDSTKDPMLSTVLIKEAVVKNWALMKEGQSLANKGSSLEEILKIFPDSTFIQTNESSILFNRYGSVPMLIHLRNSSQRNGSVSLTKSAKNPTVYQAGFKLPSFSPNYRYEQQTDMPNDVVGSNRGIDERQQKSALILAPYYNDFGSNDDYHVVKPALEKNRNYAGNITVRKENISLADYEDLDQFDLVHLSTHSQNYCGDIEYFLNDKAMVNRVDDESCRTLISINVKHNFTNAEEVLEFLNSSNYRGLLAFDSEEFQLLHTFFDYFYDGKLQNKIWYFSSCEVGDLSDVTSTMQRIQENGHFLYWTKSVEDLASQRASKEFYNNLTTHGVPAPEAYQMIPAKFKTNLKVLPDSSSDKPILTTYSSLEILSPGNNQHAIELVEMLHPETHTPLSSGELYPVVGDFGDGHDEELSLSVILKGYTAKEFEEKKMRLSLTVDEETVLDKIQFLPNSTTHNITITPLANTSKGIAINIPALPITDVGDKTTLTLRCYLHLDEDHFSIHSEKVTIKAEGILALMDDGRKIAKFYYDNTSKAVKIVTDETEKEKYMDSRGYFYFYNESKNMPMGWLKSKSMASMFMGAYSFSPVTGDEHINDNDATFNFPIISWAQNHRRKDYESNPNFTEQVINCGDDQMCTKFSGHAGQEKGQYVIFSSSGQLIEMGFEEVKFTFKYGEYSVRLPEAEEISFNFNQFMNKNSFQQFK